jgi:AraC-like DNA-binding protein
MRPEIHIGLFDLFIFLGVFQGIFISWFFIKNSKNQNKANLYQGFLLLALSIAIFEELLNNTGYIVQMLPISNFSEPLNFTFPPLLYLYFRTSINPNEKKKVWPHFILSVFWLLYMTFYFIQPNDIKYNSYIGSKHPDWGLLDVVYKINEDPLGLRYYCNELLAVMFVVYMGASIMFLSKKFKSLNQSVFHTKNETLILLRNTAIHFSLIITVFLVTKLYYGMRSDIGGYWIASYISFMIYATSYQILNKSDFFNQPSSFLNFPMPKYHKSSLSEENKEIILSKITREMEEKNYFTNNLASLSGLAKQINESHHHVSQVINEQLDMNFFELLAKYRVEEAKKIILADKDKKITIEELAEQVGYNSKSAFNNAFKKLTSKTPSEFRENG